MVVLVLFQKGGWLGAQSVVACARLSKTEQAR
jgi:hypothetical protein